MKKYITGGLLPLALCAALSGCGPIGEKDGSLAWVYGLTAVLSLLLLMLYLALVKKRELWFILLFGSVFVVNLGYLSLSVSSTLEEALLANRIAYLGSVLLPMAMLMIILGASGLRPPRWLSGVLLGISLAVFLVAASPGYLNIYYKEVTLVVEDGTSVLKKVYGPWHSLYLFYLLLYFTAMVAAIIHSAAARKLASPAHAVILCVAVLVNIGVWLLEQLVDFHFEFLAVSYIISELFLLGLHLMVQEAQRASSPVPVQPAVPTPVPQVSREQAAFFAAHLPLLTPTERIIFDLYVAGMSSKDILKDQNIKENTLKYHNRNIYSKLGVSSRRQLLETAAALQLYQTEQ